MIKDILLLQKVQWYKDELSLLEAQLENVTIFQFKYQMWYQKLKK